MFWVILAVRAGTAVAAPQISDVQACMEANLPERVRVQKIEVTSYDRAGQPRVMTGAVVGAREAGRGRVMARVDAPGDLAGTAFLVREASTPEMYLYLPGVNRVKRIAGAMTAGKLWGTDFTFGEFREVSNAFAGGSASLEGADQFDGRPVHVMTLLPRPGEESAYDSTRVLVDQKTCVTLKAEFRRAGRVRKQLSAPAAKLRKVGEHWYAAELELRDLVFQTRTRLRVLEVSTPKKLSANYFHPQQFYSAR
jgi:hypothetical protein